MRILAIFSALILASVSLAADKPDDPVLPTHSLARVNTSEAADVLISQAEKLTAQITSGDTKDKTWNDVIQMYSMVLKRYPDAVHGVGGDAYVMASDYCRDRILEFPPDGLEAYNARFNSEAERNFLAAKSEADPVELRGIVKTYFATSSGDDACYELANHYLEKGRYGAALGYLDRIDRHPAPDVNKADIWVRRAICLKRTGRTDELSEHLKKPAAKDAEFRAAGRAWKAFDFVKSEFDKLSPFRVSELGTGSSWPVQGGNAGNNARIPDLSVKMRRIWSYPLPDPYNKTTNPESHQQFHPVATADTVYTVTNSHTCAVWALGGAERWKTGARWPSMGRDTGAAVSGSIVYGIFANWTRRGADQMRELGRRLYAFDAATGTIEWRYVEPDISMSYRVTPNSHAPPIFVGNRAYLYQFREEKKIWRPWGGNHPTLVCMDPRTGRIIWETKLAVVPNQTKIRGRHCEGSVPVEYGGAIYVQANCGVIGAVDASSGDILWLKRYNQKPNAIDEGLKHSRNYPCWLPSLPVVHAGILYAAPTDAYDLYALDTATGKTVLTIPRGDARQFLGADRNHLYLTEARKLVARDRTSGKVKWERDPGALVVGRGAMSETCLYVPTEKAIVCVTLKDGSVNRDRSVPLGAPEQAGNLIALRTEYGPTAVTVSNTHMNMYYDPEAVLGAARRAGTEQARFVQAEVLTATGKTAEAMTTYRQLSEEASPVAVYGGKPVRSFAAERLFEMSEALAKKAATTAAWEKALAAARSDLQVAAARLGLAEAHEKAGAMKEAAKVYFDILSSGVQAVTQDGPGMKRNMRRLVFERIEALKKKTNGEAFADLEKEAAALSAEGTDRALADIASRFANSSPAAAALEKLLDITKSQRAATRYAGELLTMMPASPNAAKTAPRFIECAWADETGYEAKLAAPVLLRWTMPKEDQDHVSNAFFLHRAMHDGKESLRLLMGLRIRGDNRNCNLQCIDIGRRKVVWQTPLLSPKLQPATITGVSLAKDLIVAGTQADAFGIDPDTGRVVWKYSPTAVVMWVMAAGKAVAVGLDNEMVGLDSETGSPIWSHPVAGYAYAGPYVHDGYAALFTRAPSKMYVFDLLGGALIAEADVAELHDRGYGSGPFIARQGHVAAIVSKGSLHGYDIRSGRKLWTATIAYAKDSRGRNIEPGRVMNRGPYFSVTPRRGYGHHVAVAKLIDPETGSEMFTMNFPPAAQRDVPAGGMVLDAKDNLVLGSWAVSGGSAEAGLFDMKANRKILSYTFPCYSGSHLGYAAFEGRILDTHLVIVTAKPAGFAKTVFIHFVDRTTGKGEVRSMDAGKSEEHGDYRGFELLELEDSILVSSQTGLFSYGRRDDGETKKELAFLEKQLAELRDNPAKGGLYCRLAVQAAEFRKGLGDWKVGIALLNDAFRYVRTEEDYGPLFRARRAYREEMTKHLEPLPVPRLAAPPTIDGETGDWKEPTVTMDKPTYFDHAPDVKGFTSYHAPNDCAVKLYLGWDDDHLYIAADVEDDLLLTTQRIGSGRWSRMATHQDMLRFGFARDDDGKVRITSAYLVAPPSQARKPLQEMAAGDDVKKENGKEAAPGEEAKAIQKMLIGPTARELRGLIDRYRRVFDQARIAVKTSKTAGGTDRIVYEAAIPWTCTGLLQEPPQVPRKRRGKTPQEPAEFVPLKPKKDFRFRMLLNVRDQDEAVIIRWLGLGPDDVESNRPHAYVPVVLK